MSLIHKILPVGPLQCNCQILVDEFSGRAAVIDPGDEADRISAQIQLIEQQIQKPVQIELLLHTHAHFDHFAATRAIKQNTAKQADICLHAADQLLYSKLVDQGLMFGFEFDEPLAVNRLLQDSETFTVGHMKFECIHTPGHSPGGLSFRLNQDTSNKIPEIVFTGDTLFAGSIGRTDLWGGDTDLLLSSIRQRLFVLDDDTKVHPGHGPTSCIGIEKTENPFLT
jgi:hydroxyacylglutathione hydrolase